MALSDFVSKLFGTGLKDSNTYDQATGRYGPQRYSYDQTSGRYSELPQKSGLAKLLGMKKGGKVKSASVRGDGIAKRGKTRGKVV